MNNCCFKQRLEIASYSMPFQFQTISLKTLQFANNIYQKKQKQKTASLVYSMLWTLGIKSFGKQCREQNEFALIKSLQLLHIGR